MSIDSINFSTKTPAFKGNYKRTEQGNPYYHTNSAMKIGGTLAGLCALGTAIDLAGNNFFQKALKNLPEADKDLIKINNKTAILANGLAALAIHLGCAAFIDHKRNEKAKERVKFVGHKSHLALVAFFLEMLLLPQIPCIAKISIPESFPK